MGWFQDLRESYAVMLGREPQRPPPETWTEEMRALYALKRSSEEVAKRREAIRAEKDHHKRSKKWRAWRWSSIILINLLFVVSFRLDVQLVEGALTASRFVGFHFADLNSALQVMLAYKVVVVNLLIGTATVFLLWWLVGGRSFCSWACPYHLLAELAEILHLKLVDRKLVKDHPLHRGTRTVLYGVFVLLAIVTGYTVFETISPVGILSRAFTYGASLALIWVGLLLLVEIFYSRRFWCRYICPIGITYGAIGGVSPLKVTYDAQNCLHEGECRKVCMVPHVLFMTKLAHAKQVQMDIGADCTRCGACLEVCPTKALNFEVKGLSKLL